MARIAVDIDGVLAEKLEKGIYPLDYAIKKPIDNAVKALEKLKRNGHYVILFTARYEEDRTITEQWLHKYGFHGLYDELVMNKLPFDVLIDDRALRFKGDWEATLKEVGELEKSGKWF